MNQINADTDGGYSKKFYDYHQKNFIPIPDEYTKETARKLCEQIHDNVAGNESTFLGPYGRKPIIYCDHTATSKSLSWIEHFIQSEVLPKYGSTHTTSTITAMQTTYLRHEARDIIKHEINASEKDALIFVGNGATGAIHKLIHALGYTTKTSAEEKLIVLAGPFEHHSNLLPWREIATKIIHIGVNPATRTVDCQQIERELSILSVQSEDSSDATRPTIIGCFSAASNVTGFKCDAVRITNILHRYGALAFFDFASAAPYEKINMNPPSSGVDAIYFSGHKIIGGVSTPGVLVAKRALFRNRLPHSCGGGTVFFVTGKSHRFLRNIEDREEGGTPDIIGSIRLAMAFQVRRKLINSGFIAERENEIITKVSSRWLKIPNLKLLGHVAGGEVKKIDHEMYQNDVGINDASLLILPIFSFLIYNSTANKYLHYNFVSVLLNDLFGIQSRGGCACAGPYAQHLLGIDEKLADRYEALLIEDARLDREHLRRNHQENSPLEILRPGFTRLNFIYYLTDEEVDFIIEAVAMIAENGWKLLPDYILNPETGEWFHSNSRKLPERLWLGDISYASGKFDCRKTLTSASTVETSTSKECDDTKNFSQILEEAKDIFEKAAITRVKRNNHNRLPDQRQMFGMEMSEASKLRWFLLPSEANDMMGNNLVDEDIMEGMKVSTSSALPFVVGSFLNGTKCDNVDGIDHTDNNIDDDCCRESVTLYKSCENFDKEIRYMYQSKGDRRRGGWKNPPKEIYNRMMEAIMEYEMIESGDRILVCLSGGKDSLSLLHSLRQYQFFSRNRGIEFTLGAVTVDPCTPSYDPSPLKEYLASLNVPYFYERQQIIQQAMNLDYECNSICAFCSRMKRGRIYAAARREKYNVLAFAQHLDDLAETFLMSAFHNGILHTMKANYSIKNGDLRIIRPLVYVREKDLRNFAYSTNLPVIPENCPACFESPKERHRTKQLLAQQEILFPQLYNSLRSTLKPLMRAKIEPHNLTEGKHDVVETFKTIRITEGTVVLRLNVRQNFISATIWIPTTVGNSSQ